MRGLEQTTHPMAGASRTRRLRATRISLAIRDDLLAPGPLGTVASVHRSAINVRRGDRILTIARDSIGGMPNGLSVASPIPLGQLGIRPGMAIHRDGSSLSMPAASLQISLAAARGWSPLLPGLPDLPATERARRARCALALAAAEVGAVGLGPLISNMAGRWTGSATRLIETSAVALAEVIEALGAAEVERAAERAVPLVGLGPGATPSGDDLLVGLSAGLAAVGHPLARPFARHVADAATGRTTALADTFLWHAGRGEFAERVHALAIAVVSGDAAEMRGAVTDALAWGASSGADLLVGLLIGIQADGPGLPARLRAAGSRAAAAA